MPRGPVPLLPLPFGERVGVRGRGSPGTLMERRLLC